MYKASAYDPRLDRFVDQFEDDGDDYLFRHDQTGPAYRVTADEKNALVAAFRRRRRWIGRTVFALYVGLAGALIGIPTLYDWIDGVIGNGWQVFLPLVFVFAVDPLEYLDASRVSLKALRDRAPIAPRLSKAERDRIKLDRVSDNQIIGAAMAGAGMLFVTIVFGTPRHLGGWIILAAVTGLVLWAIVQGTRKYLLARADHVANNLI